MTKPDGRWATKEELSAVIGISPSGFEKSVRRAGWFDVQTMLEKIDGRNFYRSPDVVLAWARNKLEAKNGSPATELDEHREIRSQVERLKLERELDRLEIERGDLVSARDVGEALVPMFTSFGAAMKALERRHGKGAVEIVSDAIDAAEAVALSLFPDVEPPPKRGKSDGAKGRKGGTKKKKSSARAAARSSAAPKSS